MDSQQIFESTEDVDQKLSFFGVTKSDLQSIALEAATARNDSTPIHPINAAGTYSYLAGVAALRMVFLQKKGWRLCRPNNIEAVENADLNLTIVFQNVDLACGAVEPKPISGKGEGAKKLIENPTGYLWEYMSAEDKILENRSVWFFCVSSDGDEVRAELSRPGSIDGGQFGTFLERIYIIVETDWSPVDDNASDSEEVQDFDIPVTKK
jgi:hypothetical protein